MTALFCLPIHYDASPFTVVSSNSATNSPASNLSLDVPTLVWKSSNLTSVQMIIDLGTGASYDTVALVGHNLRSTDSYVVTTGTTNTGTGSYASGTLTPHSETIPKGCTAKSLLQIGATRTERYMKITFTATSHPDGFVTMQRLVVGASVTATGLAQDFEKFITDQSVQYNGPNYEIFDIYNKLNGYKGTVSWISEALHRSTYHPLLMQAGRSRGLLFTPNVEVGKPVADMIFGRFQGEKTSLKQSFYDAWDLEFTIAALAP